MNYKLSNMGINPIASWLDVFSIFSLTYIDYYRSKIDVNFSIQAHHRDILIEFMLKWMVILDNHEYTKESRLTIESFYAKYHNMLSEPQDISTDSMNKSFQQLFTKLETMQVGFRLYQWSQNSFTLNKKNEIYLKINSNIRNIRKYLLSVEGGIDDSWPLLLEKYRNAKIANDIYEKTDEIFNYMSDIKSIVLDAEEEKLKLYRKLSEVSQLSTDKWDVFVMKIKSADLHLRQEIQYQMNLRTWNKIRELLSEQQVRLIEDFHS